MPFMNRATRAETLRYVAAGCLSSTTNLATFYLLRHLLGLDYLICNSIAWVATVLVAYVANRKLVFRTSAIHGRGMLREFFFFVGSRLFSGVVDMLLMWGLVAGMGWSVDLVKLLNSAVVTALNYLISKLVVFRPDKATRPTQTGGPT